MHTNKESRVDRARRAMREANELPQPTVMDIDPEDPTQLLDDAAQFSVVDLDVEAQPAAEADAELDAAVAEAAGETTADAYAEGTDDTGELYGVHVPRAADRDLDVNPDGESFKDSELGEHAFESLEKKAAEGGAAPEAELDIVDNSDADRGHHSTEAKRKDRPVADKGSGGKGGL